MTLSPNNTALVAVESLLLAGFIVLAVLSIALFIHRRSHKVFLLLWAQFSCLVPKSMSGKAEVQKALKEVADKAAVDLLVSGLLFFAVFRTISEAFRVGVFATRTADGVQTRYVELISSALFMLGFGVYNILFISLAWLWLKVALVLFSKSQKKCLSWAVGILLFAAMLLMIVPICLIAILNLIPAFKYGSLNRVYSYVVISLAPVFFASQILQTIIIVALAIKICLLMRTSATTRGEVENKDEEQKIKTVIRKVSIALVCFIAALLIRGAGLGLVLLRDVPAWAIDAFFMGVPEFTGCLAVIYVLWPYSCSCRKRSSNSTPVNDAQADKATVQASAIERCASIRSTPASSPRTPVALSQLSLLPEAQEDSQLTVNTAV